MSPRSAPTRKHVSSACVACRESKVKCDGGMPACQRCQQKGKECEYTRQGDKRKVSLRTAIEILSARVNQLSQVIEQNGLQLPGMENETATELERVLQVLDLPYRPTALEDKPQPEENLTSRSPNLDWVLLNNAGIAGTSLDPISDVGYDATLDFNSPPNSARSTSNETPADLNYLRAQQDFARVSASGIRDDSDGEIEDDATRELSARFGSLQLAGDGQMRYYGPTSNLNLINLTSTETYEPRRTIRSHGQQLLDSAGVGQAVDPAIEENLISLYFSWQDPCFHVVDERIYRQARAQWRTERMEFPYYSEVLTNAICAAGAALEGRYHSTFITWPRSLADHFADRAKSLLDIELDSPSVATVQALVILSHHEAACKRDARAWLYSGMAGRIAYDLGLHVDMAPYIRDGSISATEAEARRVAFWGTYIVDHLSGFYYGRPHRMNSEDISVKKPESDGRVNPWIPYSSSQMFLNFNSVFSQPPLQLSCCHLVYLCEAVASLGLVLYGRTDISKQALQEFCWKVTEKLWAWKAGLPESLDVKLNDSVSQYLPHVLTLHMQYYQFLIYLHRPWVSKTGIQPNPPQGPGHVHARLTCIESANAIVKLLRRYEERYSFQYMSYQAVSITFTAALVLIFATRGKRETRDEAVASLSVCFRALEVLSQSYESARRARDVLTALQGRWAQATKSSKHMLTVAPYEEAYSSKRMRTGIFDLDDSPTLDFGVEWPLPDTSLDPGTAAQDDLLNAFTPNVAIDSALGTT